MILKEYINMNLNNHSSLTKNDLFKIIIFLSRINKSNVDIYLNINNKIDFSIKKSNFIINKFLYKSFPIEYIIKKTCFYNIIFFICKGVFIPRPETENMVKNIIERNKKKNNLKVLDLCSGSGCISNTIQMNCKSFRVYGIEKKIIPFIVSNINKKKYNLDTTFIKANIFKWIKKNNKKFDIVISNPPYVEKSYDLPSNVKKEPSQALFANNKGLEYYIFIINNINKLLNPNGILIFEIGFNQKKYLIKILKNNNIYDYNFEKDQFGNYRNLYIKLR